MVKFNKNKIKNLLEAQKDEHLLEGKSNKTKNPRFQH